LEHEGEQAEAADDQRRQRGELGEVAHFRDELVTLHDVGDGLVADPVPSLAHRVPDRHQRHAGVAHRHIFAAMIVSPGRSAASSRAPCGRLASGVPPETPAST
jgi:hypothetical protein